LRQTISYEYDLDGRRTARIVDGVREDYVYGPGEALSEVRVAGVAQQRFGVDPADRVTRLERGGATTRLMWDADDHLGSDDRRA